VSIGDFEAPGPEPRDAVGNRTVHSATITTTLVTTYTYDAANRLTWANDVVYTWDDRGNLLAAGPDSYGYDGAGRMVRAEGVTSTLVYTYNANGLRVAQDADLCFLCALCLCGEMWAITKMRQLDKLGQSGYDCAQSERLNDATG